MPIHGDVTIPGWLFSLISGAATLLAPYAAAITRSWFRLKASKSHDLIEQEALQRATLKELHKRIDNYERSAEEHERRIIDLERESAIARALDFREKSQPIEIREGYRGPRRRKGDPDDTG